jgi:hypothetical protein
LVAAFTEQSALVRMALQAVDGLDCVDADIPQRAPHGLANHATVIHQQHLHAAQAFAGR